MPETEMTVAESAGPAILVRSMPLAYGALRYPRLHRAQWLSPDEIRDLQWRRLERMLHHAYARSPLYRERFLQAGITPADIRSTEDLRFLPVTTREDLRQPEALLASGYPRHRLRSSMTSGSTGRRTTSYFDEPAWVLAKHLLKLRARQACGVRPWDRIALFQEDALNQPIIRPGARRQAFTIHRPIKEIAWECPARQGYHLNADWLLLEAQSGDAAAGEPGGRLLVTSLYNYGMPLLRYEVGDTGLVLENRCACGRGLP